MIRENYYSGKMSKMSDEELQKYTDNRNHFQEEAVMAAIWELERRGSTIENVEIEDSEVEEIEETSDFADLKEVKGEITLYSPKFIFIFGVLFSVFGAGILMAMNFASLDKKNCATKVIIYSLIYSLLQVMLFELLDVTSPFVSMATSVLGVYLLDEFVWKKEIPGDLKYVKRAVWKPILIGFIIILPFVLLIIQSGGY